MTETEYLLAAAQKSRWNLELWLRYLNKYVRREQILLSSSEIEALTHSQGLTSMQKQFLKAACQEGSQVWERCVSYSEPAKLTHLKAVLAELKH